MSLLAFLILLWIIYATVKSAAKEGAKEGNRNE
jgi:hypothetical protein